MLHAMGPRMSKSFLLACAVIGCGARTNLEAPNENGCTEPAPICIVDGTFCEPATTTAASCEKTTHRWSCPAGARPYARAPDTGEACLPFQDTPGLAELGNWGLSALSRVPTDDGRCLWIAENAKLASGVDARNVAFEVDRHQPFGACPKVSTTPPTPVVTMEDADDASLIVQIDHGYRLGGKTHVLYRLFRLDADAVFGVTLLGGGVAHWDAATGRIVIPSSKKPFPWGMDLDLGDAVLDAGDGVHAYVWGCGEPGGFLRESCRLARLDVDDHVEIFTGSDTFMKSVHAADGAPAFESGAWSSSVAPVPGGFRHVFVGDFGHELLSQVAESPLGPWREGPSLGACVIPHDDDHGMCAGPIVHGEIADPTRPGELPIVYGLGTTGTPTGHAIDYWTRLVWVK